MNVPLRPLAYRLAPGWRLESEPSGAFVLGHTVRALQLRLDGPQSEMAKRLLNWIDNCSGYSIERTDVKADLPPAFLPILDILIEAGVIWPRADESAPDEETFSRNLAFWNLFSNQPGEAIQLHARLQEATVVLIGVGGFGSWLAYLLAGSGVGRLILLDPDVVTRSNLSRQVLFAEADIGASKVEAARTRLLSIFRTLTVDAIRRKVESGADLYPYLSDKPLVIAPIGLPGQGRSLTTLALALLEACSDAEAPLMFAGSGFVGPILRRPNRQVFESFMARTAVAEALSSIPLHDNRNGNAVQPALACRLGATSSICAWEATRYLAGIKSYAVEQIILIDTMHYASMRFVF